MNQSLTLAEHLHLPDDAGVKYVWNEVFQGKCYAPVPYVLQPKNILDIGSNVGISAAYFRTVYPGANIVCVEPDPTAFQYLARNALLIGRCEVHKVALGNKDRTGKLFVCGSSVLSSVSDVLSHQSVDVIFRDAQTFCGELGLSFDMVKIDTEGSEMPIIESLYDALVKTPVIHIEFHSEKDRHDIDDLFFDSHYLWRGQISSPHRGLLTYVRRKSVAAIPEPALSTP